ncbi:MAG TPA: Hint domain-containing protein [Acetobacteraceae bacterium]|nr:Hint domain-containing protein [Acetobacteraceae bacterium]
MSSTITSASWAAIGTSGSWADATKWNPASVPGANTNVAIGNGTVSTTTPWAVSVTGNQAANNLAVEMGGPAGTLDLAGGTLAVGGNATLGYGSVGSVLNLSGGAALGIAGNTVTYSSTIEVNGATITTGGYADLNGTKVTLENGVWNADTLWIGQFGYAAATVGAGAHITATSGINVGYGNNVASTFAVGTGTVLATGGGVIAAPTLHAVDGSVITIDALSGIDLGGAPSVAGAVAVGGAGTLALEAAKVQANVVDNGMLTALKDLQAASISTGTGPVITGALSGTGTAHVGAGYTLEVGNAAGFAGTMQIDAGATLRIDAGGAPTGAINMSGGTIDLRGLTYGTGQPVSYSGSTLVVGGDTLNVGTGLSAARFTASADASGGTMIVEAPCYAAGTHIATPQGEVAVEMLRPGDKVRTAEGRIAPVRWVGQTTKMLHQAPHAAPIRIAPGAFGPGLPRRELLVSPDHALAVDGLLIPAHKLVNGATIRQDDELPAVTYVHVELDRHDLLLAEGLPAESYLDTGNRGQFADGTIPRLEDPEEAALRIFAEHGCAPLVLRGPLVEAVQARLRARAETLGWALVPDAALVIECDVAGMTVAPDGPDAMQVVVPPGTRTVRLASRSFIPAQLDPAVADGRRLGMAIAVELDDRWLIESAFGTGWYAAEPGVSWRWTNGEATLRLPGYGRHAVLTLHMMRAGARYWVQREEMARAA